MEKRDMICISCPLGCQMTVTIDGSDITVTGNTCKRGDVYARKEILSPSRIVTSSVRTDKGSFPVVSVKTETDIPKGKIMDIMEEIHKTKVTAPVKIGDIVIENCAGTGVNVIATKNVEKIVE